MKQYCRYCINLCVNNVPYCMELESTTGNVAESLRTNTKATTLESEGKNERI